jgi:hypothetical protein
MASQRLSWGLAGMIAIFTFKLSDLIAQAAMLVERSTQPSLVF